MAWKSREIPRQAGQIVDPVTRNCRAGASPATDPEDIEFLTTDFADNTDGRIVGRACRQPSIREASDALALQDTTRVACVIPGSARASRALFGASPNSGSPTSV